MQYPSVGVPASVHAVPGRRACTLRGSCPPLGRLRPFCAVVADGFRRTLLEKGIPPEKISVIPNFIDTESITPQPKATQSEWIRGQA